MNNSSANNFLLKSVQAPAVQAAAPKRNYQDDASSRFHQNFKDVQDSVRAERQPVAKPSAKKIAAADNQKSTHEVEKKPSASKQVTQTHKDNQSVQHDGDAKPAEDAVAKTANADSLEPKAEHKKSDNNEAESGASAAVIEPVVLQQMQAGATSSPEVVTTWGIPVVAPVVDVGVSEGEPTQDEISVTVFTPESTNAPASSASTSALPSTNTNVAKDAPDTSEQNSKLTGGDLSAVAQEDAAFVLSAAETAPSAQQPVVTPDKIAEQDPALVTLAGQVQMAKPVTTSTATSVLSQTDSQESDVEASTLVELLPDEKPVVKPASSTSTAPVVADAETPKMQDLAPKTTFEKTLQNMIQPSARGKDDSSPQSAPAPAITPSPSALDSLMRFGDTQAPAARGFVVQTAVPVPVGQPQWSQAVGDKVLWLAAQNVSSAEINLNPEHLGPMQVKVSVNQEQTSVSFTSHHAVVREVLDQNLGRLRDMFSEQGLHLVNVDVSDKSFSRQQGDAQHHNGQGANKELATEEEAPVAVSLITQQRLVDHYA